MSCDTSFGKWLPLNNIRTNAATATVLATTKVVRAFASARVGGAFSRQYETLTRAKIAKYSIMRYSVSWKTKFAESKWNEIWRSPAITVMRANTVHGHNGYRKSLADLRSDR